MKLKCLALFALLIWCSACVHKAQVVPDIQGDYPPEIAAIMVSKCAIPGCHNQASYGNADSLLLDTWGHLFQGGSDGAVVIPYSTAFSSLLFYVNTNPQLGPLYPPLMPVTSANRPLAALTATEYTTLSNWIKAGAPDKNGNIAFASDPATRQKSYLIHGDCDKIVAVIDSKTGLAMRVIPTGDNLNGESGHGVKFSPDGAYAYISLIGFNKFQKIDVQADTVIATLDLTNYADQYSNSWADMKISPDGKSLMLTDFYGSGCALLINTTTMTVSYVWPGLINPHAVTANVTFDTFFVTAQNGNCVYRLARNYVGQINILDTGKVITAAGATQNALPDPHDILMAPDYSKFFVTCQDQNRVQVIDAYTNKILDSIKVGGFPQDMAISTTQPYLFITCKLDNAVGGGLGSVYVINYNTMQVVKVIYDQFYAPHGLTVDDKDGLLYIASSNLGGTSHHPSQCGSPNGWYNAFYLSTLQPAFSNKRFDIFADPYAMDTRFK